MSSKNKSFSLTDIAIGVNATFAMARGVIMVNHQLFYSTDLRRLLRREQKAAKPAPSPKPVVSLPSRATADRFVCSQCRSDITRASLRIAVGGQHRHSLPDSYGVQQEIGCFSLATGCTLLGPYALGFNMEGEWRMIICATCGEHLGWHYQTNGSLGFYGLILENLKAALDDADEVPA
jgi:hypothetical protein